MGWGRIGGRRGGGRGGIEGVGVMISSYKHKPGVWGTFHPMLESGAILLPLCSPAVNRVGYTCVRILAKLNFYIRFVALLVR